MFCVSAVCFILWIRQAECPVDRAQHALVACDSLPGEVVGGPVINGGSDEWKTERQIDGLSESDELDRAQSLIMKEGEDSIKFTVGGTTKKGIRRDWALNACIREESAGLINGGLDRLDLLGSQKAALPRMRIHCGDRNFAAGEAEPGEFRQHKRELLENEHGGDPFDCGCQRKMDRRQNDFEPVGQECHGEFLSPGQVCEKFCVPRVGETGCLQPCFVQRRRDHRAQKFALACLRTGENISSCRLAAGLRTLAGPNLSSLCRDVDDRAFRKWSDEILRRDPFEVKGQAQTVGLIAQDLEVAEEEQSARAADGLVLCCANRDFRPYAGRIAGSDSQLRKD